MSASGGVAHHVLLFAVMHANRLIDLLLGASLVAGGAGCTCPDGKVEDEVHASRSTYAMQIDACLANDAACASLCRAAFGLEAPDIQVERCVITSTDVAGAVVAVTYVQPVDCIGGRRPDGFVEPCYPSRTAGAWLARIATLEAASVTAFARLVRALQRFDAPARLIAAARAAIADELVHARLTARLARRFGGSPQAPVIAEAAPPSLATLARENAVEGQVAETFGALVATCQGQLAADAEIRGVFAAIAADEARHAALAHALAPWLAARLTAAEHVAIDEARRQATRAIVDGFDPELAADDRVLLGMPDTDALRRAASSVFAQLA